MRVRFVCYPTGLQAQGFAYRVISLECGTPVVPFGASATAIARGDFEPRCDITVSAVRRSLKAKVRQLLLDVAVAHYRLFLNAHPNAAQGDYRRLDFHYHEADGQIVGPNGADYEAAEKLRALLERETAPPPKTRKEIVET